MRYVLCIHLHSLQCAHIPATTFLSSFDQVLEDLVNAYMKRNMWDHANTSAVIENCLQRMNAFAEENDGMPLSAASVPEPSPSDAPTTAQQREVLQEYSAVASMGLLPHQQPVHDAIVNNHTGIVVLSGAGGAGKTHVLKHVTNTLRNYHKKTVLISATTARAALNLSRFGRTLHSAFGLAVASSSALTFWQPFHPNMMLLRTTDVFVIDEMSMLTQQNFFFVLYRIMSACGYANVEEVLAKKLIILSGDLFQVSLIIHVIHDTFQNICSSCSLRYLLALLPCSYRPFVDAKSTAFALLAI